MDTYIREKEQHQQDAAPAVNISPPIHEVRLIVTETDIDVPPIVSRIFGRGEADGKCAQSATGQPTTFADELVERCLKQSVLWDEVKDRLDSLGTKLSGGQQQRLTLARALSLEPEILCLDEFSIAIDPVTTMKIEDVLVQLKEKMTIILVTNLIQQAQRISDDMMFLNDSDIVELGPTAEMFANPKQTLTEKYLAGEMG